MRANQTDQLNKITPADREAYLALNNLPFDDAARVRSGQWDETDGMQTLAKHHRQGFLEGQTAMRFRAASVVEGCGCMCTGCLDAIEDLLPQVYSS
jgi:hypothetical protein